MLDALTLTLPMPPNLTNRRSGGSHWRSVKQDKDRYYRDCDMRQAAGLFPGPPARPFATVTVRATMYVLGAHDADNLMARTKWIWDYLVTRGYLAGDSRKHLQWEGLPEQVVSRTHEPRAVITLTPLR